MKWVQSHTELGTMGAQRVVRGLKWLAACRTVVCSSIGNECLAWSVMGWCIHNACLLDRASNLASIEIYLYNFKK